MKKVILFTLFVFTSAFIISCDDEAKVIDAGNNPYAYLQTVNYSLDESTWFQDSLIRYTITLKNIGNGPAKFIFTQLECVDTSNGIQVRLTVPDSWKTINGNDTTWDIIPVGGQMTKTLTPRLTPVSNVISWTPYYYSNPYKNDY